MEDPLEKGMATYSVFLPGKSQGERGLAGYSLWAHRESDAAEQLSAHTFILYVISVFFSLHVFVFFPFPSRDFQFYAIVVRNGA